MSHILQPYQVSVVNYDLETPETLQDVFYSLQYVSNIFQDVFQRIENRIDEERKRLATINTRFQREIYLTIS
jgi:hypothetical protein